MSKKKLTQQQIEAIANSKTAYEKLAKEYGTSKYTIQLIKDEFNTKTGRGNGKRTSGFKVTDEERKAIIESTLPYDEIGLKYGLHESTIGKIKRKAGIFVKRVNHNREKIHFTDAMIERLKDVTTSGRKLAVELGLSVDRICRKRKELGVNYDEWKLANPKPRDKRIYKPRPKKPTVNARDKVELDIKIIKPVKKDVTPMRMTTHEYENDQMAKAKKAQLSYQEIEEQRIKAGWKFITVPGRFNIKETKFVSPEDYKKLKQAIQ